MGGDDLARRVAELELLSASREQLLDRMAGVLRQLWWTAGDDCRGQVDSYLRLHDERSQLVRLLLGDDGRVPGGRPRLPARVGLHLVIGPSPGETCWVGHCLDLDVVTQGRSEDHVLDMLREACGMVVGDDLVNGRDLSERRASPEHWADLARLIRGDVSESPTKIRVAYWAMLQVGEDGEARLSHIRTIARREQGG